MGRGQRAQPKASRTKRHSAEAREFINGTSDKVTISIDPRKVPKGPEHVLSRGKGTGVMGKTGKSKHRADRKAARQALRSYDE
jgi:hypothetical protein